MRLTLIPLAAVIWLLYLLPAWALGWHELAGRRGWSSVFVVRDSAPRWLLLLWSAWRGHALPFAAVVRRRTDEVAVEHELAHCTQWERYGAAFPAVYLAMLVRHGYRAHPLEIEAVQRSRPPPPPIPIPRDDGMASSYVVDDGGLALLVRQEVASARGRVL